LDSSAFDKVDDMVDDMGEKQEKWTLDFFRAHCNVSVVLNRRPGNAYFLIHLYVFVREKDNMDD